MGKYLLMDAKQYENMELQKNMVLLSRLSAFQILLDHIYELSCPKSEDYANRRDLIRIFNEIAKEMYGNDDKCPVVEIFGSFLMDLFNARSDLDLSINFSDQLFEADRVAKIKTLRKFAKKFYALRKGGHVTTVELVLSARVPVLKVTDSGSGIECDFSVGNRDGIVKSHIVLMISAIDERFRKLSFMMKAWAKSHDINSSKDGTLNSLSLILLAAFHLQTRNIPILPPFSAIFKDGLDPAAVKNRIPSFLNYGKRNKESLAELFVSLLLKLESVETLWLRGLCASTYEGSWIHKNFKANEYIKIEDFTDRSQNTARAVRSLQIKKIYSCIRHSLEQIQSFTEGKIDAVKLKNLLFGKYLSPKKIDSSSKKIATANVNHLKPSQSISAKATKIKRKHPTKGGTGEGQRVGKQGKHCHNTCSAEAPRPSRKKGVKKKAGTKRRIDPVTSNTVTSTSFPGVDKSQETPLLPLPIQGSAGFRPQRTDIETTFQVGQPYSNLPIQGSGEFRSQRTLGNMKYVAPSFSANERPVSNLPIEECEGYGPPRTHDYTQSHPAPNFPVGQPHSYSNSYLQGSGASRPDRTRAETLRHAALNYPPNQSLPFSSYGEFRPERTHVETMKHAAPIFPSDQPLSHSNPHIQGYGGFRSERIHVDTSRHAPTSFPPIQGSRRFVPERMHVETPGYFTSESRPLLPANLAAGFRSERTFAETINPATSFQTPLRYTLSSNSSTEMPTYRPYNPTASYRNPAELQRSCDPRPSFLHVPAQFPVDRRPY